MAMKILCPVCGGGAFSAYRGRDAAMCDGCGSLERTRALKLVIDHVVRPKPGMRVLHLQPEPSLLKVMRDAFGEGYDPAEIKPRKAPEGIRTVDPWADFESIEHGGYDVVIHSHVLQRIPGNYTIFLQRLHALIAPGGYHLFSVPLAGGFYAENADQSMAHDERKKIFGGERYLRRFGKRDFELTLGAVFGHKRTFSLTDYVLPEYLLEANIPEEQWAFSGSTIFITRK